MEQPKVFFDEIEKQVSIDAVHECNGKMRPTVWMSYIDFEMWLCAMLQEVRNRLEDGR